MFKISPEKTNHYRGSLLHKVIAKFLSLIIALGAIYGGLQAIANIYLITDSDMRQERNAYKSVSLGQSSSYIDALFGVPIINKSMENGLTYTAYETKKTYFVAFYDKDSMVAFFSFLKDGSTVEMPYALFPDKLGNFQYSDMSFPAQEIVIDVGNGNMGYGLYEEYHGSGRWGYYCNYVIGECSIGTPVKSKEYLFGQFAPYDAGKYTSEEIERFSDDTFVSIRDASYPNFAGVVAPNYEVEFPVIDFYLSLGNKSAE